MSFTNNELSSTRRISRDETADTLRIGGGTTIGGITISSGEYPVVVTNQASTVLDQDNAPYFNITRVGNVVTLSWGPDAISGDFSTATTSVTIEIPAVFAAAGEASSGTWGMTGIATDTVPAVYTAPGTLQNGTLSFDVVADISTAFTIDTITLMYTV